MSPVIEAKGLTKVYDGTTVVDNLNLWIDEGQVFGLLGPNGAGKTTTMLMLVGLTEPTSGTATIAGFNSTREPLKVKRVTGYVPEKVGFYEDRTAASNLLYIANLNGIYDEKADKAVAEGLAIVGLSDKAHKLVSTFSRGMKQRLAIADMIVKAPKVAFMDEPTTGIDPEGITQILDLIKQISNEKKMTLVISSHQLNQIERICQRVGIMSKGKMVAEGPLDQLEKKASAGKTVIELQLAEITQDIIEAIKKIRGVIDVERIKDTLIITCSEDMRRQLSRIIQDKNGLVVQMKLQSHGLEDVYLKYFKEA
jgi:ABC-2 type transport system ATP-binding protein